MKLLSAKAKSKGLALVEVLAVIACLIVLAAMLPPALADRGHKGNNTIRCLSNQKQIVLGFIIWDADNGNQFPWQVSVTNGGALESAKWGYAAASFRCLSNYLRPPLLLVCPTDRNRFYSTNFARFDDQNLSYFISLDVATNAWQSVLTGDRHLAGDGKPVKTGLFLKRVIQKSAGPTNFIMPIH